MVFWLVITNLWRPRDIEYFEFNTKKEVIKKAGDFIATRFSSTQQGITVSEWKKFGKQIVEDYIENGVFEKSEGAIIFKGEKYDPMLHTRVFINKEGLPTYEAKELGLAQMKYDLYPYDTSVVITGNEVNDYFRVLLKAMEQVFPDLAKKTKHLSHGMLRLPSGKMSSRTGSVITGESLLYEIGEMIQKKVSESEKVLENESILVNQITVAALKYSILKQSPGRDIVFDPEKSISFEGDSGPYLQYSFVRAKSIIEKAKQENIEIFDFNSTENVGDSNFERLLYRFPEIVERSTVEYAPHHIANYLIDLSRAFNTYYGEGKIVDKENTNSSYKVALTQAFSIIIKNGLWLLGIESPDRM